MKLFSHQAAFAATLVLLVASPVPVGAFWKKKNVDEEQAEPLEYGTDISFPMQHDHVSTNYPWLAHNVDSSTETPEEYKTMPIQPLGDKQSVYEKYVEGCMNQYEGKSRRCLNNERERIEMTLRQPQSMRNYTEQGFAKIRAPEPLMELLYKFWHANNETQKSENWPAGNTYVNHWEGDSYMVSVEDANLEHGGYLLKQMIWNAARDTLQTWTGQQMAECSLYGIRVYKEGAILAPHVDRLPLVSSAIINVAQDVDEPWPLEVIGHDGKAHNVTMVPGDLVLYESHSIIHGRPFPLNGRFMANVFIHFEPVGPLGEELEYGKTDLPPYVIPGSPEEEHWRTHNPDGHKLLKAREFDTGSTDAHLFSREGMLNELKRTVEYAPEVVNASDKNGWQPIHEAVRAGDVDIIRFLLEKGVDVNSRTKSNGASALHWARQYHDEDHPVIVLLKEQGAKDYAPGQKVEL